MIPVILGAVAIGASFLMASLNKKSASAQSISLNDAPLSLNVLGQPWPDIYGEFKTSGTVLAWTGLSTQQVQSSSAAGGKGFGGGGGASSSSTIYYRTFALGLCLGQADAITTVWQNSTVIWSGYATPATANAAGYTELSTTSGTIRLYWGSETQLQDDQLAGSIPQIPFWRGYCYAVFVNYELGGSDSLPQLELVLRRYPPASPAATAGTVLNGVGANPIYRVYELLTDPARGAYTMPAAWLDPAAFAAAAAVIETGASDSVESSGDLRTSLSDLLSDIDGALVFANGKFKLVLLRDRATDLTLAADDVLDVERIPSGWWEQPTQAYVTFSDRLRRQRDNTIPLLDAGSAVRQDKLCKIALPRVTDEASARLIGSRKLAFFRRALLPQTITVNRAGAPLEAGDVLNINAPTFGLAATDAWRVIKIEDNANDEIKLTIVSDVFASLPILFASVAGGGVGLGGSSPILTNYLPVSLQLPAELPWDFAKQQEEVTLFAARVSDDVAGFALYASLDGVDYDVVAPSAAFTAGGALGNAQWPRFAMDRLAFLEINTPYTDLSGFNSLSDVNWFGGQMLILTGNAIFAAREIFLVQQGRYRVTGLIGPLADSVFAGAAAGDPVFVLRLAPKYFVNGLAGWTNGSTLRLKAVPFGSRTAPDISACPAITLPIVDRSVRPYPVTNLQANGRGPLHAPVYTPGTPVRLSWIPRTRGAGAGYSNSAGLLDPNVSIEGDFVCRIYVANTLTQTFTVPAATLFTDARGVARLCQDYDAAVDGNPAAFVAKVTARVNGWESQQSTDIMVTQ